MPDINIEKKLNDLRKSSKKTRNVLNDMPDDMPGYKKRYNELWSQKPKGLTKDEQKDKKKKADYDKQITKWYALSDKLNKDNAKYKNEKKQRIENLKEEIITTQALMTLKSQNKEIVTQKELNEAIEKEVFVFQALDSFNTSMLINIAQQPEKLFSIKEQFKKEYPMYEKNVNLRNIKYVFDRKKTEKDINNYSTERTAAMSIALLTLANNHQKDIDDGKWSVEDFYSKEKLGERSEVFDEVMDKIQKADHAWIAEQIYEGTKAIAKLSDKTAKDINWQVPDVLKDEKVLMLAQLGHACFDCNQEMEKNCCIPMLKYIKEKHDKDIQIVDDTVMDSNSSRKNINTINKHMNKIHAEAHLSNLDSPIEEFFKHAMDVAMKKEFGNDNQKNFSAQCATVASAMEIMHEIVGRVKAHNSVPSRMAESFDHLKIEDMPDLQKQVQDDLKNDPYIQDLNSKLLNNADLSEKQTLESEKAGYIERKEQDALAKKKEELTEKYPYKNLTANNIASAGSIFIPYFMNQMSPVAQDKTGTIGSNLMTDIASGEFSKTVGGHTPLKVNISYGKNSKISYLVETKICKTIPSDEFIRKYGEGLEKNVLNDLIKKNQPKKNQQKDNKNVILEEKEPKNEILEEPQNAQNAKNEINEMRIEEEPKNEIKEDNVQKNVPVIQNAKEPQNENNENRIEEQKNENNEIRIEEEPKNEILEEPKNKINKNRIEEQKNEINKNRIEEEPKNENNENRIEEQKNEINKNRIEEEPKNEKNEIKEYNVQKVVQPDVQPVVQDENVPVEHNPNQVEQVGQVQAQVEQVGQVGQVPPQNPYQDQVGQAPVPVEVEHNPNQGGQDPYQAQVEQVGQVQAQVEQAQVEQAQVEQAQAPAQGGQNENVQVGQAQGGQPVKHAWEDETVSRVIKTMYLCNGVSADLIHNRKKSKEVSARYYLAVEPGDTEAACQIMKKNLSDCPETKTRRGMPRLVLDDGTEIVTVNEYSGFAKKHTSFITNELKKNLESDLSDHSDSKFDKMRTTLIQLIDTKDDEYARAVFLNPTVKMFQTSSSGRHYGMRVDLPVSRLKQQLGTDTFNTLADNKILSNQEMLAAVETENLLAKSDEERELPENKEKECKHLHNLWLLHRKMIKNFEAVCKIDINQFQESGARNRFDAHEFDTHEDDLFTDPLSHLTASSRGPITAIGWIRGEKKAIENGWELDELGLLGMIGRLEAQLTEETDPDERVKDPDERVNHLKNKNQFIEDIAELKAKIWDKPVTNITEKKKVADEISKFINDQKRKNPLANEKLSKFPMGKVNLAINKINKLAGKPLEQKNPSVTERLERSYKSSPGFVPFLSELTRVSSQERDSFLNDMNETEDGKKYLKNCAKTLMETLNDQRKRINERIDQLSQSYLENQNTFPANCREHINYEPLRKQVALNAIKKTETYRQFAAYNKLAGDLAYSEDLSPDLRRNLDRAMKRKFYSRETDRAYHFDKNQTYTNALNDDNTINVKTLSTEIATQRTLFAKYKEKLDTLVDQSKAQFNALKATLTNPNNLANRSGEFVKMYRCVEVLSQVDSTTTPVLIEKTVNDLLTASRKYIKKNQSDFKFTPAGRKRLNAAENILKAAQTAQFEMIRGRQFNPQIQKYDNLNGLRDLYFNRNKTLAEISKDLESAQPQNVRKRAGSVNYSRAGQQPNNGQQPDNAHSKPEQRNRSKSVVMHN